MVKEKGRNEHIWEDNIKGRQAWILTVARKRHGTVTNDERVFSSL